jgi:hypothetical protein
LGPGAAGKQKNQSTARRWIAAGLRTWEYTGPAPTELPGVLSTMAFWIALVGLAISLGGLLPLYLGIRRPAPLRVRLRRIGMGSIVLLSGLMLIAAGDNGEVRSSVSLRSIAVIVEIVGWTTMAFGVAIAGWGLCSDRSRGRARCPRCWYSMEGAATLRCPECGHDARVERRLYKTRRQRGMLLSGIACGALGYAATVWPDVQQFGIASMLPTPVLFLVLEAQGWPRPASYGPSDIAARFAGCFPSAPKWLQAVARRRMARYWTIDYRRVWPAEVPIAVRPVESLHNLLERDGSSHLEARLLNGAVGSGPWVQLTGMFALDGSGFGGTPWSDGFMEMGPLPLGAEAMRLEFRSVGNRHGEPLWTTTIEYPITVVPRISDVLTPVTDSTIGQELANGLDVMPYGGAQAGAPRVWLNMTGASRSQGIAEAAKIEFLRNGRVEATARVWSGPPQAWPWTAAGLNWSLLLDHPKAVAGVDFTSPAWTIRITSDPEMALRDLDLTRYWSGSVVAPSATSIKPAPRAPSIVDPG